MGKIRIRGGISLSGSVTVGGSKNAVLPIVFASLATRGVSVIKNAPDISDLSAALEIIEGFGASVSRSGDTVTLNTESLFYRAPDTALASSLRASTYLIGAGLARFGKIQLTSFGGCNFSRRPIDMHLYLAEKFGAVQYGSQLVIDRFVPANVVFRKRSVGATVNALILAASVKGVSRITPYAKEPHILTLIEYLRSAGASITASENTLTVVGGSLRGAEITIPGDMIEAGTYLAASLITDGSVRVRGFNKEELSAFAEPFCISGGSFPYVLGGEKYSPPSSPVKIITGPYPMFPTDLQPISAPLLAASCGGEICDTVFPERFGYLEPLRTLGVDSEHTSNTAKIKKSRIKCGVAEALDLRGGAAALITALAASGESIITKSEIILRGYGGIVEKLSGLGAEIDYT